MDQFKNRLAAVEAENAVLRDSERHFRNLFQNMGRGTANLSWSGMVTEHQGVLLAELQHRVRNIMGIIRSMANRSAEGASVVDECRSLLEGRLLALARVQALLTR